MLVPAKSEIFPEIWRKIPSFHEYYASTSGRIRGKRGILIGTWNRKRKMSIIKLEGVTMGKPHLILTTFRRPLRGREYPHFIDGNRKNLRADNLKWTLKPGRDTSQDSVIWLLHWKGSTTQQISSAVGRSTTFVLKALND